MGRLSKHSGQASAHVHRQVQDDTPTLNIFSLCPQGLSQRTLRAAALPELKKANLRGVGIRVLCEFKFTHKLLVV
ncbi:hypothetical protein DIU36_08135 [Mucilaginibacter rubeus]|nr:hypothetical protein DIU36_08135 [Mucilaginibacter rubeus]